MSGRRTVDIELGGEVYAMPVTFKAFLEVVDRVGDPMEMAFKQAATKEPQVHGKHVIDILAIGIKHSGGDLSRSQVGQQVLNDGGIWNFHAKADEYIASFVMSGRDSGAAKENASESGKATARSQAGE